MLKTKTHSKLALGACPVLFVWQGMILIKNKGTLKIMGNAQVDLTFQKLLYPFTPPEQVTIKCRPSFGKNKGQKEALKEMITKTVNQERNNK